MIEVKIREAKQEDYPFIRLTWFESFRPYSYLRDQRAFIQKAVLRTMIQAILKRSIVLVAHDPSDTDLILGWLCWEPQVDKDVLHYAYSKGSFPRQGIFKQLLTHASLQPDYEVSHSTMPWIRTVSTWKHKPTYNIERLYVLEETN